MEPTGRESLFKSVFSCSPIAIGIGHHASGQLVDVNDAWLSLFSLERQHVIGQTTTDLNLYSRPEERQEIIQILSAHGRVYNRELQMRRSSGEIMDILYSAELIEMDSAPHLQVMMTDITERKQADIKIQHLTNLYAALSACTQAIVHCSNQEELFQEVCRHTVTYGGMRMAWIGLVDPQAHKLRVSASYGTGVEYLENLEVSVDADSPSGRGPTGTSIREKRPIWCQDFQNDPATAPWHERGATSGWKASASLPLFNGSVAIGALTLYAAEVNPFDETVCRLMVDMSMEISYALDNFAREAENKQSKEYREMGREVLQLLNEPGDLLVSIQRVISILKTRTGLEAVAIRLQDGDDYPYFAQEGFPPDFLVREKSLTQCAFDDKICQGKEDCNKLLCTCGLVISGKTDPSNSLFTTGGSFWTNDSLPLLDIPSNMDPRLHPRNECIHQGYASFALVPIRSNDKIVGLLQLNDTRNQCFTPTTVSVLEEISSHIGSALLRKQAEKEKATLEMQLQQAQKMESVGRLAGGVAHDFNNMLSVILGYVHLGLYELDSSQPHHAYLTEIRKAAERSADLTKQLLAFARKQTIEPKILDLNETVASMLKMLQRLIGEDIHLVWQPTTKIWTVKVDPSQIDQILANLCVNSRDAIANVGKITIETGNITFDKAYCEANFGFIPGEYVLLAVSDDGCGMNKEIQAHIFEPFFTTKVVGQGTGLGLATVYGIVKQNNGFINIYSEPGHGTTFKIYLPRHEGANEWSRIENTEKPLALGQESILLVEDEPSILNMTTILLEKLGYIVLAANTPSEAVRLAREYSGGIQLLLTDVVMPEMNGRDLARNLRALYPMLKTLFTSGYTANVIAHHGVLDEGVNFIPKPFSLPDLASKVREVLDGN